MHERRNYYRILQVQPDAPEAVIRSNYRTLLQKLRLHPDLGGSTHDASLLNVAWRTLRDPVRRAAYYRELLARYSVQQLAGAVGSAAPHGPPHGTHQRDGARAPAVGGAGKEGNRRNYYRVLQVQPDASEVIIRASYQALCGDPAADRALLDEAFAVLGDADRRRRYDAAGAKDPQTAGEQQSADDPRSADSPLPATIPDGPAGTAVPAPSAAARTPSPWVIDEAPAEYRPLIRHWCAFCRTPHNALPATAAADASCIECESPLAPVAERSGEAGREATRTQRDDVIWLQADWPGDRTAARLVDLSPHGALVACNVPLPAGQVVRLGGTAFEAVGEVVHRRSTGGSEFGVSFLAARFAQADGNFVATCV